MTIRVQKYMGLNIQTPQTGSYDVIDNKISLENIMGQTSLYEMS